MALDPIHPSMANVYAIPYPCNPQYIAREVDKSECGKINVSDVDSVSETVAGVTTVCSHARSNLGTMLITTTHVATRLAIAGKC